jgi:chromosome segregation ATPase
MSFDEKNNDEASIIGSIKVDKSRGIAMWSSAADIPHTSIPRQPDYRVAQLQVDNIDLKNALLHAKENNNKLLAENEDLKCKWQCVCADYTASRLSESSALRGAEAERQARETAEVLLEAKTREYDGLASGYNSLQDEVEILKAQERRLRERIELLEDESDGDRANHQEALLDKDVKIEDLEAKLLESQGRITGLMAELGAARAFSVQAKSELNILEERCKKAETEVKLLQMPVNGILEAQGFAIKERDREIARLKADLKSAYDDLASAVQESQDVPAPQLPEDPAKRLDARIDFTWASFEGRLGTLQDQVQELASGVNARFEQVGANFANYAAITDSNSARIHGLQKILQEVSDRATALGEQTLRATHREEGRLERIHQGLAPLKDEMDRLASHMNSRFEATANIINVYTKLADNNEIRIQEAEACLESIVRQLAPLDRSEFSNIDEYVDHLLTTKHGLPRTQGLTEGLSDAVKILRESLDRTTERQSDRIHDLADQVDKLERSRSFWFKAAALSVSTFLFTFFIVNEKARHAIFNMIGWGQ